MKDLDLLTKEQEDKGTKEEIMEQVDYELLLKDLKRLEGSVDKNTISTIHGQIKMGNLIGARKGINRLIKRIK